MGSSTLATACLPVVPCAKKSSINPYQVNKTTLKGKKSSINPNQVNRTTLKGQKSSINPYQVN
jgi:hypothetical protein